MVNNALFAGSKCEKVSKKNTNRREEKGEGERESSGAKCARAFESINLAGIEFIGNYFSRAYGPFAGIEDKDRRRGGGDGAGKRV